MELSRSNIVVRWAYLLRLLTGEPLPMTTSACALFWRVFVGTPVTALITIVASPLIAVGFAVYIGGRALVLGVKKLVRALPNDTPRLDAALDGIGTVGSLIGAFASSLYRKACPIVWIR